ncbi:programmed cell death protein 7-like [Asterias rubens]|uniref:programmed cell death protein 7-like n=1 Tax=Asterias rubens TaxID=7604 RepID=UPI001454F2B4|nr:programmed cell death protein 7-like [Asterias rubens]
MDRGQRQGGSRWSQNKDGFDPGKNVPQHRHQPNRTESVSNTPAALDQFLSGISIERNNQREPASGGDRSQMGAALGHHQGPPIARHSLPGVPPPGMQIPGANPLGALPPGSRQMPGINPSVAPQPGIMASMTPSSLVSSSQEWDSYQGANKTPNWQVPPPPFAFRNQNQTQDPTMNWQHSVASNVRQNNSKSGNNSEQRNAPTFNRAAANLLPSSMEQSSSSERPPQEQQRMSRERQHPLRPAQSGQNQTDPLQSETRPTQQLQRNFHNQHQVPRLNHQDQQHNQQYQQKQGPRPQQPEPHPHQFGPHFGGEPHHRSQQPYYPPHHEHQEQNLPGVGGLHERDGPEPFRSHPPGPPPQGSSQARPLLPSGPHPSGPHPSGSHPPGPLPQGSSQARPLHPSGPQPSGPHPSGPHPSGPHPSGPHPSPRMHQPFHSKPPNFQPPRMPPQDSRHQHNPGFVPRPFPISNQNRLPPPPQIVPEKSQRDKDEEWMKDWLMKRKIGQPLKTNENTPTANTVNDGRQLVVDLMQTLQQLAELKETLSQRIKRDESSWQYECRRVNRQKEKVEALQSRLFGSEFLDLLQNKIKKRKKKRERIKRQRQRQYQMELEVEERRAKLHSKIDARLAKELQTYQDSKREAELQEEIDKTLYEVRKKKQEASQTLDLIKGLKKLRQLRKDAAQVKGIQTSREADIAFDRKLKPLEELMSKQRDLYREEEKTMQVMLEEEHEEYKEQERKKMRRRQEEKALKEMQANMKVIFGKDELVGQDARLFPFQQFYHQAESNMHALVDIRRQWDPYLVPDADPEGSSIPVSWVLPSEPSSTAWASVLDT